MSYRVPTPPRTEEYAQDELIRLRGQKQSLELRLSYEFDNPVAKARTQAAYQYTLLDIEFFTSHLERLRRKPVLLRVLDILKDIDDPDDEELADVIDLVELTLQQSAPEVLSNAP